MRNMSGFIKLTLILLYFAFFLACAAEKTNNANPGNESVGKAAANEGSSNSPVANVNSVAIENPTNRADKIESIYSDLAAAKCKTLESNEEEEWIVQECPGVAGYKLEVSEGDLRQTINIISPKGKKSELDFWSNVSSGFSELGDKAEWRVKKDGEKLTPFALITRYNVSENPDKPEKTTSYLVVTKISGESSCIVEIIKPIAEANEKARISADSSANKPCLERK